MRLARSAGSTVDSQQCLLWVIFSRRARWFSTSGLPPITEMRATRALRADIGGVNSDLERITKIEVARRLSAPEADVLSGGFEQHDLHVLRRNVEWVKVSHHGSIQFSLRFEGTTLEQNNLNPRETFPGGKRCQIIAGRCSMRRANGSSFGVLKVWTTAWCMASRNVACLPSSHAPLTSTRMSGIAYSSCCRSWVIWVQVFETFPEARSVADVVRRVHGGHLLLGRGKFTHNPGRRTDDERGRRKLLGFGHQRACTNN